MLRLVSGSWVAALLGLGGLAMAQDGLVVDPWKRVVASVFDDKPAAPPASDRIARPVGVASFPIEPAPSSVPSVVPVGPPLNLSVDPWSVVPVGPALEAGSTTSVALAAEPLGSRRVRRDWAFEIREIIDPWGKGPLAVVTDPLIVDPWAR